MIPNYDSLRKRAPTSLDLDALANEYRARTAAKVAEWRDRYPGANSAILEVVVQASGHTRRRLRRYREFSDAQRGTPGFLVLRQPTSFNDWLDFELVAIGAAAARVEVHQVDWRFLTVAEALEPTP